MGDAEKTKKILLISIIGVAIIAVVLVVILTIITSLEAEKNNFILDGAIRAKMGDNIVSIENDGIFFSIESIANSIDSYEYYNGEYQKATEDKEKGFIQSPYEISSFNMDSSVVYKIKANSSENMYDTYNLKDPIKRINGKLYTNLQGICTLFNIRANYDQEKNVLEIQTLPYLYSVYDNYIKSLGYTKLSDSFTNQKSILSGFLIVSKDGGNVGVINTKGESVIGTKYTNIQFIENTTEFLVESGRKYGIITKDATTKVDIKYDEIKLMDNKSGLYLIKSGVYYGVLKSDGNILLPAEYDYIGIRDIAAFPNDEIKNPYILLDTAIPVYKNRTLGLYALNGAEILALNKYNTLGCIVSSGSNKDNNVLIIPETEGAEGVVIGGTDALGETTYGIFSLQSRRFLSTPNFSRIYSETVMGETTYYMSFSNEIRTVKDVISGYVQQIN